MMLHKTTVGMFVAVGLLSAMPLFSVPTALAQAVGNDAARQYDFGRHIEGHIAFLKTELRIRPDQEAAWSKVADAMRTDVAEYEQFQQQHSSNSATKPTALQHLEERAAHAALRAKGEQRFLDAFRPLYGQLSDAQKQTADELLGRRREEF